MRYSIQSRDRINLKSFGLLSFTKNMGKNIGENRFFITGNQKHD